MNLQIYLNNSKKHPQMRRAFAGYLITNKPTFFKHFKIIFPIEYIPFHWCHAFFRISHLYKLFLFRLPHLRQGKKRVASICPSEMLVHSIDSSLHDTWLFELAFKTTHTDTHAHTRAPSANTDTPTHWNELSPTTAATLFKQIQTTTDSHRTFFFLKKKRNRK